MLISVVIPTYKARASITKVIDAIPNNVSKIYVVDDACPDISSDVLSGHSDSRLIIIKHSHNQGVGGAVLTGYHQAFSDGADVVVKIDSDGQMDPRLLPKFIAPIRAGLADYTKGNRFYHPEDVSEMPLVRKLGNLGLSFLTKISSGYWDLFDPTNGYTAIHKSAFGLLQTQKISRRYFFETDMLFRLNLIGAVVVDVPMRAVYADETSNLSSLKSLFEFSVKHMQIFTKRIIYKYFLRDFNVGSIELLAGVPLLCFGTAFGTYSWIRSLSTEIPATAGTVMTAALPVILGFQLLLNFLVIDSNARHKTPLQKLMDE